jgi:hypothetical protein
LAAHLVLGSDERLVSISDSVVAIANFLPLESSQYWVELSRLSMPRVKALVSKVYFGLWLVSN